MPVTQERFTWYDVSEDVKDLLILASEKWENTELSEQYINQALDKAGDNLDVLIGAYRFFFYKGKADIALEVADKVLKIAQQKGNLPANWEEFKPILLENRNDLVVRLYVHAYAARGFLLAKLGRLEEARYITQQIQEIDKNREYCATTVFEVLTKISEED